MQNGEGSIILSDFFQYKGYFRDGIFHSSGKDSFLVDWTVGETYMGEFDNGSK